MKSKKAFYISDLKFLGYLWFIMLAISSLYLDLIVLVNGHIYSSEFLLIHIASKSLDICRLISIAYIILRIITPLIWNNTEQIKQLRNSKLSKVFTIIFPELHLVDTNKDLLRFKCFTVFYVLVTLILSLLCSILD